MTNIKQNKFQKYFSKILKAVLSNCHVKNFLNLFFFMMQIFLREVHEFYLSQILNIL